VDDYLADGRPPLPAALVGRGIGYWPVLIWTARLNSHSLYFLRREVAMLGKIIMTLLAFSSAALAQQQQCQLECTLVTQSGEARVTKSCYALDAEQCALVAKADTGGQQTCRGYLTTNCVDNR
jgi:hypothetical protein